MRSQNFLGMYIQFKCAAILQPHAADALINDFFFSCLTRHVYANIYTISTQIEVMYMRMHKTNLNMNKEDIGDFLPFKVYTQYRILGVTRQKTIILFIGLTRQCQRTIRKLSLRLRILYIYTTQKTATKKRTIAPAAQNNKQKTPSPHLVVAMQNAQFGCISSYIYGTTAYIHIVCHQ